ncbi:type I restriction endonuclease subunit R [Phaeobacter italicus]|uniref:type I restriction endonuclease subunit R n=1 Tax=Phaeobacter italicus TaxID=481446 RepID=UPI001ADA05E5|nr:HsdR family type I site-specific deoxyribonuclease [Phaeobacter italicus]MBO9444177.1 type I restriction endonuclease subunit R [Phaeobacter italicus]
MTHQLPDTREEAASKLPALHMLMGMGWTYLSQVATLELRGSTRAVLLEPVLRQHLQAHRFVFKGQHLQLSDAGIAQVLKEITSTGLSEGLRTANEATYKKLTLGVTVTEFVDGQKTSVTVPLINWNTPQDNSFHVTEEFSVQRAQGNDHYRPDLVCFVNGIPMAVIEAKRPTHATKETAMVEEGISQHNRNQKEGGIPALYVYSQLLLSISGSGGLYGTTGTDKKFWSTWHEEEIAEADMQALKSKPLTTAQMDALFADRSAWARKEFEELHSGKLLLTEQDRLIVSLLRPDRLLDLTRRFIFFDSKMGKIVARYQQVQGTKAILAQVANKSEDGSRKGGVIWHTTGSGKSNLMVFLAKALLTDPELADCRLIIVTDRVDLEKQLARTFLSGGAFGSVIATKKDGGNAKVQSGEDLAQRIGYGNERIIFTLLQKFNSATKYPECKNTSDKLIVLVDEGHRSQGGENHERMRQALPNAAFIAFTGTPLLKKDKTRNKFGPILHAYTMSDAIADGAVTPLVYEERKPLLDVNDAAIDAWFDTFTQSMTDKQKSDLKKKYSSRGQIYGAEDRIDRIALDIATHFNEHFKQHCPGLKAQLATDSKLSAIRYKEALDATGLVSSAVVISPPDTREGHDDTDDRKTPEVQAWWEKTVGKDAEAYETAVISDFGTDGGPDILIVVDKLLTGFDEPRNAVLYIDKLIKGHNLLQAIARVNRLHEDKQFGYLIDYRGILAELDTSIKDYQDLAAKTQAGYDIDDLKGTFEEVSVEYKRLPSLHDRLWSLFAEVENKKDREQFRRVLVPRMEDDGTGHSIDLSQKIREDFYEALTEFGMCLKLALASRTFYEDSSFDEAVIDTYKRDLKFFTEIRAQARQDAGETVDFSQYEQQIRQLVDKHVIGQDIVEPEGFIRVADLGQAGSPEEWSDEKMRTEADVIKTRIRKTIEQELIDDPYAQKVFSDLLKDAIKAAEAMFDHPHKQYVMFKDLEQQVSNRATPGLPDSFSGNYRAQAFYGVLLEAKGLGTDELLDQETLVQEAFHIDQVVSEAVQAHSINPANIEAAISKSLLPRYFQKFGGLDQAEMLVGQLVAIVRSGGNRA